MSEFDKLVDKLIEEESQEEINVDELFQSVMDKHQVQNVTDSLVNTIQSKIAKMNNNNDYQNTIAEIINNNDYNEEEINYMNSPYYANYVYTLKNIYNILAPCVLYLEQNYL